MHKKIYDKKKVFKCLAILVTMVAAMHFTKGIGFAIIIPIAFLSLTKDRPEDVFFYVTAIVSTMVANPRIATKGVVFFMEQRATLLLFGALLAAKAMGGKRSPIIKPFMGMLVYLFYMAIISSAGWSPLISYLKLFLFTFAYFAYFGAANAAAIHPRENITSVRSVILSIAIFFLIGSVALIPFPGLGQMDPSMFKDDPSAHFSSLFMGMTNHSQCLGPLVSALAVLLFTDLIFGVRRLSKLYILLLACCPILIWKTSSRTALGTFLAGMMFASYFFMKARWVGRRWRDKVVSSMWLVAIALSVAVACSGSMRQSAANFIQKRLIDDQTAVDDFSMETLTSSRMWLVKSALANFKESPIFGNGFQVSKEMSYRRNDSRVSILSAPIEKGVWVTAVLEEGGIIGFIIFVTFLLNVLSKMIKYKAYITASVFFVTIVSNFGEFSFFSSSYLGGFLWAMVFAGIVLDSSRARAEFYELKARMEQEGMQQWQYTAGR